MENGLLTTLLLSVRTISLDFIKTILGKFLSREFIETICKFYIFEHDQKGDIQLFRRMWKEI